MQKEMIYLKISDFIKVNLDQNIAVNRKDSEYDFNFTRWKNLIYSSTKLKFVLKYVQSVLKWLAKAVDVSNYSVSIDTTSVDRFNLSLYEFDTHIFNSTLFTNFYLIPEKEWAAKISEMHHSKIIIENGNPIKQSEAIFWKGEEGFERFVNVLYALLKEPFKFEGLTPIQWQIDFKDRKATQSQIRLQISSLNAVGAKVEDPYLTVEQAIRIENGEKLDKIIKEQQEYNNKLSAINPLWDEAKELEERFKNVDEAMKFIRGVDKKGKNRK